MKMIKIEIPKADRLWLTAHGWRMQTYQIERTPYWQKIVGEGKDALNLRLEPRFGGGWLCFRFIGHGLASEMAGHAGGDTPAEALDRMLALIQGRTGA